MWRSILIGVVAGWALWGALIGAGYACEAFETWFPKWAHKADIPDTLGTVLIVAALPVAVGGWLFIWGDGPQPPPWVTSVPFNVAVGLILYGLLGGVIAIIYGRRRKQQQLI